MRRLVCILTVAALVGLIQLPLHGQEKKKEEKNDAAKASPYCPPGSFKYLDGRPLVFVVNGVSGSTHASDSLVDLNGEHRLGLRIQPVAWCRHNAMFQDLLDNDAQLHAASRIASTVQAIRQDNPNLPIFLVGHSAGARVVLAAGEMMPPGSVDRIITLHAAVSCGYDLTGALRGTRGGIDNFYSQNDGVLDAAVYHHTLADGTKGPAAGRAGFWPCSTDKKEVDVYRNVRQYRWTEDFCGNGGHYAWTLRHNMKKAVVPLFFFSNIIMEPPAAAAPPQKLPK